MLNYIGLELHRTSCQLFRFYQELAPLFASIWGELKKLRNRSGQFARDMHWRGISETSAWDFGLEVQTCTRIL